MKRKFKYKKRFKLSYLLYIVIIYLIYQLLFNTLFKSSKIKTSDQFVISILDQASFPTMKKKQNAFHYISRLVTSIDTSKPLTILENAFNYESSLNHNDDYSNMEELKQVTSFVEDPSPTKVDKPKVYLYNSHQLENYSMQTLEVYNITPNVLMTSYLLKEKLNKLGINTIALEEDLSKYMEENNLSHADSYKVSRKYLTDALYKYDSIELFIDLHRDSIKKQVSTTTINNQSYAKILFVVGLEHPNNAKNLAVATKINNIIKRDYPNLTRGILKKSGKGVDGIYNQDVNENVILIEVGGYENTIDEVNNTIEIVSKAIKEYLDENGR